MNFSWILSAGLEVLPAPGVVRVPCVVDPVPSQVFAEYVASSMARLSPDRFLVAISSARSLEPCLTTRLEDPTPLIVLDEGLASTFPEGSPEARAAAQRAAARRGGAAEAEIRVEGEGLRVWVDTREVRSTWSGPSGRHLVQVEGPDGLGTSVLDLSPGARAELGARLPPPVVSPRSKGRSPLPLVLGIGTGVGASALALTFRAQAGDGLAWIDGAATPFYVGFYTLSALGFAAAGLDVYSRVQESR